MYVETFAATILARILPLTDLEARRWVATENMQRENLSSLEEVEGIVEMLDAELYDFLDYAGFAETSVLRVRFLLGKLNADYNHKTEYFVHKFMHKTEAIFASLPTKKEWRSFYVNDLPLLNMASEVIEIAVTNKLNSAQTKALNKLNKTSPDKFAELVANQDGDGDGVVLVNEGDGEKVTLRDTSAKEIVSIKGTSIN